MTLTDFEALAERDVDGQHYELDEGELVTLSPTARPHAKRVDRIYRFLIKHLPEERYDVLPGELGFILSEEPNPTVRGADLAVMYRDDDPAPGFVREMPLLIIEVISPGNSSEDIEKKRLQYLAAGVPEVWIVYPKTKTMHVSQHNGVSFTLESEGGFTSTLGFPVANKDIFRP